MQVDIEVEVLSVAWNGGVLENIICIVSGDEMIVYGDEINIVLLKNTLGNLATDPSNPVDTNLAPLVDGHGGSEL